MSIIALMKNYYLRTPNNVKNIHLILWTILNKNHPVYPQKFRFVFCLHQICPIEQCCSENNIGQDSINVHFLLSRHQQKKLQWSKFEAKPILKIISAIIKTHQQHICYTHVWQYLSKNIVFTFWILLLLWNS